MEKYTIRKAEPSHRPVILEINRKAFGRDSEAELTDDLLSDPTAQPILSLLACKDESPIAFILFSRAYLETEDALPVCYILGPLAVLPAYQNQGVGGLLIQAGLEILQHDGCDLVFVLGHPSYYSRFGFQSDAGARGFSPPHRIAEKDRNAWMYLEFFPAETEHLKGVVRCCRTMDHPEAWRE